jgi:hypothetical protein
MKKQNRLQSLSALVSEQLAAIGAAQIPASARHAVDADILAACASLIRKRITGEYVGRMVAVSLSAATREGSEGEGTSPSASQPGRKRSAHPGVAGQGSNPLLPHDDAAAGRRPQSQEQEGVS